MILGQIQTPELPEACGSGDAQVDIEVLKSIPNDFCINSDERANWLVRKILAARAYAGHVKAWFEQEQRPAAREEQTLMFLFGRQIQAWARAEIQRRFNGRRQSLPLPAGTVGYRKVGGNLVIDDERLVINWSRMHCPQAVTIVEKLSKSTLDAHLKETGELPDVGVHLEPQIERFYVR